MTASLTQNGTLTTPQLRYTENQVAVCEAMLAFNQNDRGQASPREIKITAYGRLALALKDVPGGTVASVSGYPEIHEIQKTGYKDKRLVLAADAIEIVRDGEFVELTGGAEDDAPPVTKRTQPAAAQASPSLDDLDADEIPF